MQTAFILSRFYIQFRGERSNEHWGLREGCISCTEENLRYDLFADESFILYHFVFLKAINNIFITGISRF